MTSDRDLLSRHLFRILVYGVPVVAMVGVGMIGASEAIAGIVWFLSLAVMGGACLWNAWRCGRVHCYFTGPFFLLMGLLALLCGLGVLPLGRNGWAWLGAVLLVGSAALHVFTERAWGRYRSR